jgi:hypothetical protein
LTKERKLTAIEHEMEEDGVAARAGGVGVRVSVEAEVLDECGVNVDESVGPDLADVVDLRLGLNCRVSVRIDALAGRIRVRADAGGVAEEKIRGRSSTK